MSFTPVRSSEDPFPEAVEVALALAVETGPVVDCDPAADPAADDSACQVSAAELAWLWRDVDAAVLVEATVPTADWTDEQVVAALAAAEQTARAATGRGLRLAAELARRRPARSRDRGEEDLSRYALDEISLAAGLARGAARGRLAEARVVAQRCPRLLDALQAGLITLAGLRKVLELTNDLTPAGCRAVQRGLLHRLGRPHLPDLHRADLAQMLALDPDVRRSIAAKATTAWIGHTVRADLKCLTAERIARTQEHAQRRVVLEAGRGRMCWLGVYGPDTLAHSAWARINGLAHQLTDPDDARTMDQKRADVFLDLIIGRADHRPGLPTQHPSQQPGQAGPAGAPAWGATVVNLDVVVDHTRCTPKNRGGCIGEAGRLGPVTADSLSELIELAAQTGGKASGGHALPEPCPGHTHHQEHGPGPYEPPESLKRQVRARWRRCVFPGCARPARECDLDHSIPHSRGGPTCICNLAPQCEHHHLLKHDLPDAWPPWRLVNHGDQLTWTSPTGLAVHASPDPPDPHPPPAPRPVDKPPF